MHISSKHGAMFDIATCMSHSMSTLLQYFDLITTTAEKPSWHKYHVANSTRTWRALQPTSGNSARTLTQNEMSDLGLYIVFKVRSEVKSINCSASRDANPERHLHYQQKDFLSNCTSPCLQKNISQMCLEHRNANTLQSSHHTHWYSAGRDCQIASINEILEVENYHIAHYLSTDQFFTTVVFFEGCNFVMELQKASIFFLK